MEERRRKKLQERREDEAWKREKGRMNVKGE